MDKTAHISVCGTYRYLLTRKWDTTERSMGFVMLNPSTADELADDPTIRRCIRFANQYGSGGIMVANLFPLRSTDPSALKSFTWDEDVKAENVEALSKVLSQCDKVVAAWGKHRMAECRAVEFLQMAKGVMKLIHCLGKTKEGYPRHPLYLSNHTPLELFAGHYL